MRPRNLFVIAALLVTSTSAMARERGGDQRWPGRDTSGTSTAAPPASAPQPRERTAEPRRPSTPAPATSTPAPERAAGGGGEQRRPPQRRDGDGERERVAVPRTRPAPDDRRTVIRTEPRGSNTVYVSPRYYYYPRTVYPYGYGAFGLGYFYYDPYTWYSAAPGYAYGATPNYPLLDRSFATGFDVGEVRLRVSPRDAQVYVDRYFAGSVDDFDGTFQGLKLASGPHHIEIVAPGFETLSFDVRILSDQKITYRGDLTPRR